MSDDTPGIGELIRRARQGDARALGLLLEAMRPLLRNRAERHLRGRLSVRVDPSDVIQLTFLDAHRSFEQFGGEGESELTAWLDRILENNLAGVIRDNTRAQKRDVRREQSLDESHGSRPGMAQSLPGEQSTPSQKALRNESEDQLRQALEHLPPDQREAVRLRHLEGWPLARIAEHMGRTRVAVASLIKRGMQALREILGDQNR